MNCLITGGSRGIGLGIANRLAKAGHNVTLAAKDEKKLIAALKSLPQVKSEQQHRYWPLDMRDLDACSLFTGSPYPPAHFSVFINSAGISSPKILAKQPLQEIQDLLSVNLHAPILLAKSLSRCMIRQNRDVSIAHTSGVRCSHKHIIFISSMLAAKGVAGSSVYSASKAGIEGFTRSLATELKSRQVSINCLAPGFVETDMTSSISQSLVDLHKNSLISVNEIADFCLYLLNTTSITGQSFPLQSI
ncbi:3-oxoacyl-[acyl-carrier-protein] reductase (NADPH) [Starmerella bacillaris]|uniref:3-oxoacyl-[acyl-carrier-protein] reductase (NADPH) n=1 Tax=Starmerella bacillaris TaxID=1247836 RepID=A0AAV5RJ25_STABA|nr:3-oxoacyl-[acyl-carrier-protein] reductase (NADPH) [Starmerella bacillaris]